MDDKFFKIMFFVEGTPAPAVRKNRSDRWKKRPSVVREFQWRNRIVWSARRFKEKFKGLHYPVGIDIVFFIPNINNKKIDGDNLYKAVLDALVYDKLLEGDSVKYIREGTFYIKEATMTEGAMIGIFEFYKKEVMINDQKQEEFSESMGAYNKGV